MTRRSASCLSEDSDNYVPNSVGEAAIEINFDLKYLLMNPWDVCSPL